MGSEKFSDSNVEVTAQTKGKDKVQNCCRQNEEGNSNQCNVVSNDQSPNEQNVPPQNRTQSSVTNEHSAAPVNQTICTDDLIHVLPVVEENVKILGILQGSDERRKLPVNHQTNEETSTDESGSSSDDSESDTER